MFNTIVGAGTVGARAGTGDALCYGSDSAQMMLLLVVPAPVPPVLRIQIILMRSGSRSDLRKNQDTKPDPAK
jgi:hypothetical protein